METVHSSTYSILLDTFVSDAQEKVKLFNAIETIPSVKNKAIWAQKWINSDRPFSTRLVAFACVEGIFFSGSFCAIFWLKQRGIMPGLCESNEWISRDEGLHQDFAVLLYTYIVNKLPESEIHEIVREAVDIESSFIIESIPCKLLGMNSDLMREYIQFIANRLILQLGYSPLYQGVKNPFSFMDRICFTTKANFFERRSTQYRVSAEHIENSKELVFDADF
jgi:ribonucleotide reductase beta subunit family protein with ferritin-like domain